MTDSSLQDKVDAAAFRRLLTYLQNHPRLSNVDLLTAANFCRDRLSACYQAAAQENGLDLSLEDAKLIVYGMPHQEWVKLNYAEIQEINIEILEDIDAYNKETDRNKRLILNKSS